MAEESGIEAFTHVESNTERPAIQMGMASLKSTKHAENEDAAFILSDKKSPLKVFGLFDGMGGYTGGALASRIARDTITNRIENGNVDPDLSLEQSVEMIKSVIFEADQNVREKRTGEFHKMGTTGSIGLIWEGKKGERKLVIGNVGDSRIYVYREGKVIQLTKDDNLAEIGRANMLTQAIGDGDIDPRMDVFDIFPGDRIIAVSDGIPDALNEDHDKVFEDILSDPNSPEQASKALVEMAREFSLSGRKMDDQTVIIADARDSEGEKTDNEKTDDAQIPEGSEVRVLRSSGIMETGWELVNYIGTDQVRVTNGKFQKIIPVSQLEELNPDFDKTVNLSDFKLSIKQLYGGGINSPSRFYPTEELLLLLEGIIDGNFPITHMPRPLRPKLEELLRIEKNKRGIN